MAVRKKWKLTYAATGLSDQFASQKAAYEFVQALALSRKAGGSVTSQVTVWVDEGRGYGWEKFEVLDLDEVAAGL